MRPFNQTASFSLSKMLYNKPYFRDARGYDNDGTPRKWVPKEYCLNGFPRYCDGGDPQRTGWYIVISDRVDSATPPPNDAQNWKRLDI